MMMMSDDDVKRCQKNGSHDDSDDNLKRYQKNDSYDGDDKVW